jgi:hypothetical protein
MVKLLTQNFFYSLPAGWHVFSLCLFSIPCSFLFDDRSGESGVKNGVGKEGEEKDRLRSPPDV